MTEDGALFMGHTEDGMFHAPRSMFVDRDVHSPIEEGNRRHVQILTAIPPQSRVWGQITPPQNT